MKPIHGIVKEVEITNVSVGRNRRDLRGVESLMQSIKVVGLLQPIVVTSEMRLVCGLHRLRACKQLGWTKIPAVVKSFEKLDAELAEIDENIVRNELTQLERSEQLLRRKEIYEAKYPDVRRGGDRGNQHTGGKGRQSEIISFSQDTAAKTGLTDRSIQHDVQIASGIPKTLRDQLHDSPIADSKTDLLKLAREKDAGKQAKAVAILAAGQAKDARTALNLVVAEGIKAEPLPPPKGPFRVLVMDPPWSYEKRKGDASHRAALPYPDMTIPEIAALPIASLAHEDCVLWLWTTNAHIFEVKGLLDAWGFIPKTILTWVKDRMGTGDWLRGKTEHCILAVRGRPLVTLTNQTTDLQAPLREHSRKPDEFYALVEALCPGSKLDLFARSPRPGWTVWGAETQKFNSGSVGAA